MRFFLLLVLLSLLPRLGQAQEARSTSPHPVETFFHEGIAAFNRHDLDLFLQQWDDDIAMYTVMGWLRGKDALRSRFAQTFAAFPQVRMEIKDLRVREVAPGTATVDFVFATYPRGEGPAWHGVGSGVYVRRGARWVEVLEHETIVRKDAGL